MARRLTDRFIAAVIPPSDRDYSIEFDSEIPGLALLTRKSGGKSFIFDWRDKSSRQQRRLTLGSFPAWKTARARVEAAALRQKADTGQTIAPERGEAVGDLAVQWLKVVDITRRPRTAADYRRLLTKHFIPRFGKGAASALTLNAAEEWHARLASRTPIEANRAAAAASAFCTWLERGRHIDRNPFRGLKRRPENQRQVFLDAEEIAAAHDALAKDRDQPAALALRLALLSGARIGEVLKISSDQVNQGRSLWVKPGATTKQKRNHVSPLSAEALAVAIRLLAVDRPTYERCNSTWKRVRNQIGRSDVRIHDLRHSRASELARNGGTLIQIGRILGHTAPQTSQRYLHLVDRDLVALVERKA